MRHHRPWCLVLLLGLGLVPGPLASAIARERPSVEEAATPGPPGERVDIGGRQLFLACSGAGSPTVVLEAGAGNGVSTWAAVQPAVASFTQVCSYDRGGVGQSDPVPAGVRTAQDSADDLAALLGAADIEGPYLLVGHSVGGLIARLFASRHQGEVAGLVLVDGTPPDLAAAGLGLLPEGERAETFLIMRGLHPDDPEHFDVIASGVWVTAQPPPTVPTAVLAAGFHGAPGAAPDPAFEALWQELQREQARALGARFVPIPEGDHFLQVDRPDLVVEAIRQVAEGARDPSRWVAATPELGETTPAP